MPDQPDDARKRQQRGVFPPFFAPRNGRGETSPTPPSGSWRRVSRLFTPPEVARQRRTPSAPQTPYTPPVPATADTAAETTPYTPPVPATAEPTAAPEAFVQPAPEVPEAEAQPEIGASETITPPEAQAPEAILPAPLPERPEQPPIDSAFPLELEQAVSDTLAEEGEAPAGSHVAAAEPLARFDSMAFDEDADSFLVESLEPEPISLAPSDVDRMEVSIESDAVDSLENAAHTGVSDSSDYAFAPGTAYDGIDSVESYLAEEYTGAADAPGFEGAALSDDTVAADDVVANGGFGGGLLEDGVVDEPLVAAEMVSGMASEDAAVPADSTADYALAEQPADADDPWVGAELPEPAFGSIGWPSNEITALAAGKPVEDVDEMSAALAWNEAEADGVTGEHAQPEVEANGSDVAAEDALSAMTHELRDSSSVWGAAAGVADENADVSARARFYGGGERSTSPSDPDAAAEGSGYSAELAAVEAAGTAARTAGDDPGAAIADALARVAARIRAGEVDLPAEVVGASDESALAAALAALLRGPRH